MWIERNGYRGAGQFEREIRSLARGDDVGWRHLHLELDTIGANDAKERGAFVVGRAERRVHFGETSADGGAQCECISRRRTTTGAQRFVALRKAGFRGAEARFGDHGRTTCVFDPPCW